MRYRRFDSRSLLKQVHCLANPVRFVKDVAKVNLRHPAFRITGNGGPIKRFDVGVHPALLPGEHEQHTREDQHDSRLQQRLPGFQSRGQ